MPEAPVVLATARLDLRRWEPADAAPMVAINEDPEVTRYLNRPVDPSAVAAFHGQMLDHWAQHGFGPFAVHERDGDGFVGFVGVGYPTFLPALAHRPELGWRLARQAWGRGLASEAARAARDHAFVALGLAEVIAIIHPENARSQRLAAGLGMTVERQVHNPVLERDVDVWRLAAPGR